MRLESLKRSNEGHILECFDDFNMWRGNLLSFNTAQSNLPDALEVDESRYCRHSL